MTTRSTTAFTQLLKPRNHPVCRLYDVEKLGDAENAGLEKVGMAKARVVKFCVVVGYIRCQPSDN